MTDTATLQLSKLIDLTDQVAVVTGGGVGIGRAIARRLAEAGAAVVVVDLHAETANDSAREIVDAGGRAIAVAADVANTADAARIVGEATGAFGTVDILVNNAGIFPFSPLLETSEEVWDRVQGVNLRGAFFLSQAAARQMVAQGNGGRIVNVASVDAFFPSGYLAHYDASKGGLVMLTKSMAKELGAHRILVNVVAPGGVDTPGAMAAGAEAAEMLHLTPGGPTPPARSLLGRYATPDEIARVVLFLATPLSDFVTGSVVVADGGFLLI